MREMPDKVREAYKVIREWRSADDAKQREAYDALTRHAGQDPRSHSCPHGYACDIHG